MAENIRADICVIGAGSAGLTVAAVAAQAGAATVLIEAEKMGGDCLNTGCVPSKALLAASKIANSPREAPPFGVALDPPQVDFRRVHDHVHDVIAQIAPNDSVERFESLGVRVIKGRARFSAPDCVEADGMRIRARRFVLATGSRAAAPPVPGLDSVAYLTNENLFELTQRPEHLVVIGGGPIGVEMAQAHRRLGSRVTVLERDKIMPKDDPELVGVVRNQLTADGVDIREGVDIARVETTADGGVAALLEGGARVEGSHLLVAAGRSINVEGLGLEQAGVEYDSKGIKVDAGLRTTNRKVYAIGDCAGGPQFTHVAGYHAGLVIRSALFRLPAKVDYSTLPWVTYTEPELAQAGKTEADARQAFGDVRVLRWQLEENDRAHTERRTEGFVKVVVRPNGRVVGASIVAPHAGELIQLWVLAIGEKMKIGTVANMIAPYPTLGEASKRAALSFHAAKLRNPWTHRVVRFLSWFG